MIDLLIVTGEIETILIYSIVLVVLLSISCIIFSIYNCTPPKLEDDVKKDCILLGRKQYYNKIRKRYGSCKETCVKLILKDLKELSVDCDDCSEEQQWIIAVMD